MKKHLVFVFVVLSSLNVCAQESACLSKFRVCRFTYKGQEGDIEIIRTKTTQKEIFNHGKSWLLLKIKWINPREYVLTLIRSENAPGCLKPGDTIRSRITQCNNNSFTCESETANCGKGTISFTLLE